MSEERLVPKLRFINEPWESKKLGKLCKITMGQSPSSSNYTENESDTVLIQGNADLINGKVVPRIYTTEVTKTAVPGDIILTVRAPVGDLAINEFNSCIGRGVCSIEGNKFIYYFLQSLKDKHVWERLSQGSTFESINSNDIQNLKVNIPSEKTQKSISNFLTLIDAKMEMLEKKYGSYIKFKKYLMQQIFAQKLRFKSDNGENFDEWKERKLS
ncbi:MAG: restriction endonuclease subunit S, partial [Methanobrevibacter sp.]